MPSRLDVDPTALALGVAFGLVGVALAAVALGLVPLGDGGDEPNDAFTSATPIEPGTVSDRQLERGEYDFYAVSLDAGESATAELRFAHAAGDLDLEAYDPEGRILARSQSITDDERVEVDAEEPGRYFLLVYGHEDAENGYDLVLEVRGSTS